MEVLEAGVAERGVGEESGSSTYTVWVHVNGPVSSPPQKLGRREIDRVFVVVQRSMKAVGELLLQEKERCCSNHDCMIIGANV